MYSRIKYKSLSPYIANGCIQVKKEYVYIKIPAELTAKVEREITKNDWGYRNRTEFIIDAIRRRLDELEKLRLT